MARLSDLFKDDPGPEQGQSQETPTPSGFYQRPPGGGRRILQIPFPGEQPAASSAVSAPPIVDPPPVVVPPPPEPPPRPQGPPPDVSVETVLSTLRTNGFAYISGPAGTGKTYLAREVVRGRTDAVLTATTGIAAVNLGDASTINALLSYFDTHSLMESYTAGYLQAQLRRLRRVGVRIIVLDEASMLEADQLTILVQALDEVNQTRTYDSTIEQVVTTTDEDTLLQMLLVGDFAQLPPVEGEFAFRSPQWKRLEGASFRLDTIRRQGEAAFIEALQAVRKGRPTEAVEALTTRMVPMMDFDYAGTTIVAKNDEVDRINGIRHAKLPGEPLVWPTVRSGEQQKDWVKLIPNEMAIKPGALVMILANRALPRLDEDDTPGFFYVNGDLARVLEKTDEGIRVTLLRNEENVVVTPLTSEWRIPTGLTGKNSKKFEVKGSVTRMPLRLAYATTVHKSQGLSLDQVQVGLASWMFTKPGMTYVALSRCRTLEGLRIVGNPKMFLNKCKVNPAIGEFL